MDAIALETSQLAHTTAAVERGMQEVQAEVQKTNNRLVTISLGTAQLFTTASYAWASVPRGSNGAFKQRLIQAYQPKHDGIHLTCMLSGAELDRSMVIAAHLMPLKITQAAATPMGVQLHSWRNGLLLFEPFEKAYDIGIISFEVVDGPDGAQSLVARLNSNKLRNLPINIGLPRTPARSPPSNKRFQIVGPASPLRQPVADFLGKLPGPSHALSPAQLSPPKPSKGGRHTQLLKALTTVNDTFILWGDIDGAAFELRKGRRPYTRVLAEQQKQSQAVAVSDGWNDPEQAFTRGRSSFDCPDAQTAVFLNWLNLVQAGMNQTGGDGNQAGQSDTGPDDDMSDSDEDLPPSVQDHAPSDGDKGKLSLSEGEEPLMADAVDME